MAKKVQIWLRVDQAECALAALAYAAKACDSVATATPVGPKEKLAGKLARERIDEIAKVIDEATAKAFS